MVSRPHTMTATFSSISGCFAYSTIRKLLVIKPNKFKFAGLCEGFYFNYIVGINSNVVSFNMKNIFEVIWVNCKKDAIHRILFFGVLHHAYSRRLWIIFSLNVLTGYKKKPISFEQISIQILVSPLINNTIYLFY